MRAAGGSASRDWSGRSTARTCLVLTLAILAHAALIGGWIAAPSRQFRRVETVTWAVPAAALPERHWAGADPAAGAGAAWLGQPRLAEPPSLPAPNLPPLPWNPATETQEAVANPGAAWTAPGLHPRPVPDDQPARFAARIQAARQAQVALAQALQQAGIGAMRCHQAADTILDCIDPAALNAVVPPGLARSLLAQAVTARALGLSAQPFELVLTSGGIVQVWLVPGS